MSVKTTPRPVTPGQRRAIRLLRKRRGLPDRRPPDSFSAAGLEIEDLKKGRRR
jgi:hypothetical protein